MIIKEYYQNINCRQPRNYFERWYADVWQRRIGEPTVPPGKLTNVLGEELALVSATFESTERDYMFRVTFKDEQSYVCLH